MPQENTEVPKTASPVFVKIAVCECALAAALIIAALVLKTFFAGTCAKVSRLYRENAGQDLRIEEIINGAENEDKDI